MRIEEMAAWTREALCEERLAYDRAEHRQRSLSYDGDPRASYLLLDTPSFPSGAWSMTCIKRLASCGLPHADWVGKILVSGGFVMP
jgi:hypothetical protein